MPETSQLKSATPSRLLKSDEYIVGTHISLRLVTLEDCDATYVSWLCDPLVNQFLETRWTQQTLHSIRDFVSTLLHDPYNYLFAIIEMATQQHIGNIKIGPINFHHQHAEISYFIGEKTAWGKDYATEAIHLVTAFAFQTLQLHRLQASTYASNRGSQRALEKAGFTLEGRLVQKLRISRALKNIYMPFLPIAKHSI